MLRNKLVNLVQLMSCAIVAMKRLSKEIVEEILRTTDVVLTDCDGVLWQGNVPVEGASEAIQHLHDKGKRIYYVTNNSTKTRAEYLKKCHSLGFPAEEENIICTAFVAANYVKQKLKPGEKVYCIGMDGLKGEFERMNIPFAGFGPDICPPSSQPRDLADLPLDDDVKCVVIGFDMDFSFVKLTRAASYLTNPDCLFVACGTDSSLPLGSKKIPGAGSIVRSVEVASGRKPEVMGKPHSHMLQALRDRMDLDPARSIMIGDRLETDIAFGNCNGMRSLLVLSGVSTATEAQASVEEGRGSAPTYCTNSIADLLTLLSN